MTTRDPLEDNPFYILGVRPGSTRSAIEKAWSKLSSLLAVGATSARSYATPSGPRPLTAEDVRWAIDELRRPERRVQHEVWAALKPLDTVAPDQDGTDRAATLGSNTKLPTEDTMPTDARRLAVLSALGIPRSHR